MGKRVLLLDSSRIDKYALLALIRGMPDDVKIVGTREVTDFDYQYDVYEIEFASVHWDDLPANHVNYYLDTSVTWSEIAVEKNVSNPEQTPTPDYSKPVFLSNGVPAHKGDNMGFSCSCWLEYTGERVHKPTCSLKKTKINVALF